jgi:nitrate reductase cytochrome c-type subunit
LIFHLFFMEQGFYRKMKANNLSPMPSSKRRAPLWTWRIRTRFTKSTNRHSGLLLQSNWRYKAFLIKHTTSRVCCHLHSLKLIARGSKVCQLEAGAWNLITQHLMKFKHKKLSLSHSSRLFMIKATRPRCQVLPQVGNWFRISEIQDILRT